MSKSRRPTLAEQDYQEMGEQIVSGHLPAGERLFAQELVGQLEIGPTAVEAALAALSFHLGASLKEFPSRPPEEMPTRG